MNKVGIITMDNKLPQKIINIIGEDKKKFIFIEHTDDFTDNKVLLEKIDKLNQKKVDFIAIENLDAFLNFNELQTQSPLLIMHPVDTLVIALARDLNQFPLWPLNSRIGRRLLDIHGFSYQIPDKNTKENIENLKTANDVKTAKNIISEELKRYKPYGVDSIVLTEEYNRFNIEKVDETEVYNIEDSYIDEIIKLLKK